MNNVLPEHIDLDNPELQQALQIIQFTHRSLFLTGKAGTGKSTFLRYICQTTKKKHVVLAPTGIAAINAGGTTLHSFFKLPFHPLLPNDTRYNARNIRETLKYNSEKRKILREVELIIIDEISMVRADIIDFIDKVLRIYTRNMRQPFGGKQLLLVGDIYQLEPGRPPVPSSFLSQRILLRCSHLPRVPACQHRAQESLPADRPALHLHPRPYPHQRDNRGRPADAQPEG